MVREQLEHARELIQARQYNEARALLSGIEHPTAEKWLIKLDEIDPPLAGLEKPKRSAAVARPVPAPAPMPTAVVNQVNVNVQATPVVLRDSGNDGPGCVIQLLWFVTLGWILSQLAIALGYLLIITIFFMPFGFMLLNKVPYLATLRSFKKQMNVINQGGVLIVEHGHVAQRPILLRLVYFLLIGFWLGFFTLELAWLFTASFLLAPAGLFLFRISPAVLTLRK